MNLKDVQVEIKFHFFKKTLQGEGKCILVTPSQAITILDSVLY